MIQALLKNNVISEGSFIFFDEPETNLHPAWQVVLTKVLIKWCLFYLLAKFLEVIHRFQDCIIHSKTNPQQVVLTKVLIKLAESGVNVVMATHSLDIIKAFRTTFRIFFHASIWCLFYLFAKFLEVTHRFQDCIIHSKTNPHKHSSIHFLILLNSQ
jgi:predicted ATPase